MHDDMEIVTNALLFVHLSDFSFFIFSCINVLY